MKGRFQLHWPAFLISIGIGILYIVLTEAPKKRTKTNPTPFNAETITYKDTGGNCFMIRADELQCTTDEFKVKKQKIQE